MKKIYLPLLGFVLAGFHLQAQDINLDISADALSYPQGSAGYIEMNICNPIAGSTLAANRVQPQLTLAANSATITGVSNSDGSPLTTYSIVGQPTANQIRLQALTAMPAFTCQVFRVNFQVPNSVGPGRYDVTGNLFWNGSAPDGNSTANDVSSTSIRVATATPVSLAGFTAKGQNQNVELSWSTAQERNNAFFEIQHSTNGKSFETVGKVEGKGTTSQKQNYNFTHYRLNPSVIHYYRLKQVDFDGKFELSSIRSVQLEGYQGINLVASTLTDRNVRAIVSYGDEQLAKSAQVSLVDLSGRTLSTKQVELEKGQNPIEFQTSALSSGLYLIRLENPSKTQAVKVALP
ncbi:T9SS type A sorting domain-containing protein [Siphonobacter sp. SORGH_AS_0500]|uniref:T9SS type A sorting domain-containing protein n=1 Tax=Siphonobacter sp. SORGH_AS_0500 TaxID=1864824 RepID=UPI00285C4414|nr:T9SS type A sorting domain-containing protein [Siphonobacter sp. SORGH_AS_0500]MDR6197527.1 hypothetical protein [Siphonobacter sp. SORGH_AS_0500]